MKLAENLKKAVLQAAMQGKLTRQLKTDSSVDDLLQKIAEEKAALIKEGKIKKDTTKAGASGRALAEITQEEIPFEIPENWRWCRLGEIGDWGAGATPDRGKSEYYKNGTIPWIKTGELNDGIVTTAEEYITELALEKCSLRMNKKNDVLIAMYGATIGKVAIAGFDLTTNQACCACTPFKGIYNYYLFYFLKANKPNFIKQSAGGAQPNISRTKIIDTLFPLPPIEEQQRIVEKLNSILPLIDEYGKEEDELVALSQNFPEDIKKSVLQSAMQGKLTKQLQTDSSVDELLKKIAEEKEKLIEEGKIKKDTTKAGASGRALSEITEEEIPFEIPENWRWVKVGNVLSIARGGSPRPITSYLTTSDDGYNWIKIGDSEIGGKYINKTAEKIIKEGLYKTRLVHKGDLLLSNSMSFGRPYILNIDGCIHDGWLVLHDYSESLNKEFLYFVFSSNVLKEQFFGKVSGAVVKNLNSDKVADTIIPLPPIEEQQRIVEKLNSILPIIDSMAVYGTKKKAGHPKQEEALSFIRTFLQAKKTAQPKTAAPKILELKTKAKQELPAAVQKYAGLMGVTYNRITIRHQKTRWGSCTKTGNLNFNCLIMKMPDQVRDYVIIHELAHRKELNHSSKYWAIVAEYCPWYKQAKQWLKDNGQELMES